MVLRRTKNLPIFWATLYLVFASICRTGCVNVV